MRPEDDVLLLQPGTGSQPPVKFSMRCTAKVPLGNRKAGFLRSSVGKLIQVKVTPIESRNAPGTGNRFRYEEATL